jgi:tetratricopeptide (TPR) repeat protein
VTGGSSRRALAAAVLSAILPTGAAVAQSGGTGDLPAEIVSLIVEGRRDEAEAALRELVATSDSSAARDTLGVLLGQSARLEEAERELRRALALDAGYQPALQHLGRLLLQTGRGAEGLPLLRKAAALGPLELDLALQLAVAERAAGDTAASERQLREAMSYHGSVRAAVELALMQAGRGEHDAAVETLRPALEAAPNSEDVLAAFAKSALASRAPVPAIRSLEALSRMHPRVAQYPYLLGVARLQIGETDGSVEALETALALAPERSLTLVALGMALNAQKRFEDAREVLSRSLDLDPDGAEALAALAEAEEGVGDLDAAQHHAGRAVELGETSGLGYLVIGKVRMAQGRFEEARDALRAAVDADPTSAKAHYQLSLAYARLGDVESSKRHRELYDEARERSERFLLEMRSEAGLGSGGMTP